MKYVRSILLGLVFALTLGSAQAQAESAAEWNYRSGWQYEMGLGVRVDFGRAYLHYCRSARAGHAGAALRLGILTDHGAGVPRDPGMAAGWLRYAATGGSDPARRLLARFDGLSEKAPWCRLPEDGETPAVRMPPTEIEELVRSHAPSYGLDPDLVMAVIQVESGFRTQAVSTKGAMGLMQIIPETGRRFGLARPFDPEDNLRAGMAYLRWLLTHFGGDVALALAGYNAGENAVVRHGGIPPYPETRRYVQRVMDLHARGHRREGCPFLQNKNSRSAGR